MPLIIDHAPVNQPDGLQTFGPVNIGDAVTKVNVRLARKTTATPTFWPNATTKVAAQLYTSLDGGATWDESCGGGNISFDESRTIYGAEGGVYLNRFGVEAPESKVSCPLPPGTGRKLLAKVAVTGGPLVSQLTVETV